jgi:CDP-diacylglycerol--glycerol-3-phosphate 3-phosphatidyltransferase
VVVVFTGLYMLGRQYQQQGTWSASWLAAMVVAALTDRLDGFLAKRYGWTSTLGAFLDQISDKLVTLGVFAFLTIHGAFHPWALGAIVLRELFVSALRIEANEVRVPIHTGQAGRFKTFVQQVAALFVFLHWAFPHWRWMGFTLAQWIVWAGWAVFVAIVLGYGRRAVRAFVRVYAVRRVDAAGREHRSHVDFFLVVLTLLLIPTPAAFAGTATVLVITLGTGWTYFAGFRWGARTAGQPWVSGSLTALGLSALVTAGLVLLLQASPTYPVMWLMIGAVSLLWVLLLVVSWFTGRVYQPSNRRASTR